MTAVRFVEEARKLVASKTRWRHQGRKPWAVDCIGLLVVSAKAAGYQGDMEATYKYGREPWDDQLRKGLQLKLGDPVADWKPGDIALIRWAKGQPSHVGIIADYLYGGLSIIHSHNIDGVTETALSGNIRDCVVAVYRPEWVNPKEPRKEL